MSLKCCIYKCPSNNNFKDLKPTRFVLPTDSEKKCEWLKALNKFVDPECRVLTVCELHFQVDDIIRVEYTFLDGKLIKLNKNTTALRKTAVPCIFNEPYPNLQYLIQNKNQILKSPMQNTIITNDIMQLLQKIDSENKMNVDKENKMSMDTNIDTTSMVVQNLNSITENNNNKKCSTSNSNEILASVSHLPLTPVPSVHSVSQDIHLMADGKVQIINVKDFPSNISGPIALRIKPMNGKVSSILEPVHITQSTVNSPHFTIYDLKNYLTEGKDMKIQDSWNHLVKDKSVLFLYMGASGRGVLKTVFVSEDLKMEVRLADQIIPIKEDNKMRNIEDISRFLRLVGAMKVCEELFNPEKTCAKLFYSKRPLHAKINRFCGQCYNLKQETSEEEGKNLRLKIKLGMKSYQLQNKLEDMKLYISMLKRRINRMNIHMQKMVNLYSTSKKKEIQDDLSFLPQRQQEVIKAFFAAVKRQPGTRKFSDEWMKESLLLYTESPKVYRYLRNKEILPLPSMDTLRTYKKSLLKVEKSTVIFQNPVIAPTFQFPLSQSNGCDERMDTTDLMPEQNVN